MHRETVMLATRGKQELVDVTAELHSIAADHPDASLMAVYSSGATAAGMGQGYNKL